MKTKIKLLFLMAFTILAISGCGMLGTKEEADTKTNAENTETAKTEENTEIAEETPKSSKTPEFTGELKFPWDDFQPIKTAAKTGDNVLVPSFNWLVENMEEKGKKTMIWYSQKMATPGDEMSEIQFMGETKKVPNAYIVAIPPGQKAKNGDILLSWWQSGSGMKRAIVVDDSDPISPVVRYLDTEWRTDDPKHLSQREDKFKPDTFVVLKNEMEPGTTIAIKEGANLRHGILISESGDKVYARLFAGKTGVFPKSDVTAVPVKPNVKEGDRVHVEWVGKFKPATVTKVDQKYGRVWVKYDSGPSEEKAIPFSDVLPK